MTSGRWLPLEPCPDIRTRYVDTVSGYPNAAPCPDTRTHRVRISEHKS